MGRRSVAFLSEASARDAREKHFPRFFKTGTLHNAAYDFIRKDGSTIPVLMSAIALEGPDGAFDRSLAVLFDNTDAKRVEEELIQSQRTDAIGRLVGGVAHDFNNLLTVIQGNLEFLMLDINDPERHQYLEDAHDAVQRGARLTQQLLAYGRKARIDARPLNCNDIVEDMSDMVQRLLPETIQIQTRTAPNLWQAEVDRHMLGTALLNLINNARDALPNVEGRVTIESQNRQIDDTDFIDPNISPGPYVVVSVRDNGTGMAPATLSKAFDPFFTTKPVGKGSGLGLSMVYGFAKQSRGTVRINSVEGEGTSVDIYFPALPDSVKDGADRAASGGANVRPDVLVVEDEADVRKVLMRQLHSLDISLAQAASGDAALAMLDAGLKPRLLLTDVVMPGDVQGPELARRARDNDPQIEVVFLSGYEADAPLVTAGLRKDDTHFVKPANTKELLATIRTKLNSVAS